MNEDRPKPMPAPRLPPPPPPDEMVPVRWGWGDTIAFAGVAMLVLMFAGGVLIMVSAGVPLDLGPSDPKPLIRVNVQACDLTCPGGVDWMRLGPKGGITCHCR